MPTDRLLIPASVPNDRLRLLDGWTGPVEVFASHRVEWPPCWFLTVARDGLVEPADDESSVEPSSPKRLDDRRPEVRAHIVDALAAGVRCPTCGGTAENPGVASGDLEAYDHETGERLRCPACGYTRSPGWLTPPHDCYWQLHRHNFTPDISSDDSAGLIACSCARIRAGLDPVLGIRPAMARDTVNAELLRRGHAIRRANDTLTLPWPDEVSDAG